MRKSIWPVLGCLFLCSGFAQGQTEEGIIERIEKLERESEANKWFEKFKISGFIQAQYQWGQEDASLKVGTSNENPEKSFSRIGIRRGRVKLVYEEGIASGVFQVDMTEKSIGVKDVYLNLKAPWLKTNELRAGLFLCPFGYEIGHSAAQRESPECSTVSQNLFPEERDMGVMLTLRPPKTSPWNILKLEAGLLAGNGIKQETDSRKDFIGHVSVVKAWDNIQLGGGASYYHGSVYQGTEKVYRMSGKSFVPNSAPNNAGKFAETNAFYSKGNTLYLFFKLFSLF